MTCTLVFCRENAQLGNRLVVYAHLLAATLEHGWELVNPTFEPYADLFVGTKSRPHGKSMWAVRIAWQAGKLVAPISCGRVMRARARGVIEVDLQAALLTAEAGHARWLLLQGYRIRCPQWATRQASALRAFFTPIESHRLAAEARLAEVRARGEVVVGIHVRQGDYATHLNGLYYYSIAQYAQFMRRMQTLLAPRSVVFLVCTHVPIPEATLAEFAWAPGPGSAAADLHALAGCDYILGPPSSFSSWAAFHGATSLMRVSDPTRLFSLADFVRQDFPEAID